MVLCIIIPETFSTRILGTASGFAFSVGRIFAAAAAVAGGQIIGLCGGSYAAAGAVVATIYAVGFVAAFFTPATSGELITVESEPDSERLAA